MATALFGREGRGERRSRSQETCLSDLGHDARDMEGREDVGMKSTGVTFVLGGARSGKSEIAEALANASATALNKPVLYVATGRAPATPSEPSYDREWSKRVAAHRARRPASWKTLEIDPGGPLRDVLERTGSIVLIDSLGTWLAGFYGPTSAHDAMKRAIDSFLWALDTRESSSDPVIVVSDEVGLGVHPPTEIGVKFRDALGALNRSVCERSDRALLAVAGRTLVLGPVVTSLALEEDLGVKPVSPDARS